MYRCAVLAENPPIFSDISFFEGKEQVLNVRGTPVYSPEQKSMFCLRKQWLWHTNKAGYIPGVYDLGIFFHMALKRESICPRERLTITFKRDRIISQLYLVITCFIQLFTSTFCRRLLLTKSNFGRILI